jgi:hydrogenase large subunit
MTRRVLGPFNRVEGDLEVTVEIEDGVIARAEVNAALYRGFEQMLVGKDPRDALVIVPRICGICSVSHSVASAAALAQLGGAAPTANGQHTINLIHAVENIADHLTHFHLFFMPDLARDLYADKPWHASIKARFKAQTGSSVASFLEPRARWMHLMGLLAGKWPHTLTIQPGGVTRALNRSDVMRAVKIHSEFRKHLEQQLFGCALEEIVALESFDQLTGWAGQHAGDSDLALFINAALDLGLHESGRATDRFLSFGNYAHGERATFAAGVWRGELSPLAVDAITEDVTHAWMGGDEPRHPLEGNTQPLAEKEGAYSWCKAPRLGGEVVETGALARQVVDGHPLVRDLERRFGGNVLSRIVARHVEVARLMLEMQQWLAALDHTEPYYQHIELPEEGVGVGLVEAARGSLGHWMRVRDGRIANYQIIAPTTWNFSPRDGAGVPGALEQALRGTPVGDEEAMSVTVQHIVRSFDPCMVCTVH